MKRSFGGTKMAYTIFNREYAKGAFPEIERVTTHTSAVFKLTGYPHN